MWTKAESLALIREQAVIPVVRVSSHEHAICALDGVIDGGIHSVEITLTVPNALSIIRELVVRYGKDLLVGAGTVIDAQSCRDALHAGAEFIVSPALDLDVVAISREHDKICMPGALTPTEVLAAWKSGADFVKVFPCNSMGGPSYIRSLKGPFPQIEFVVTGSVTLENVSRYFEAGVSAVGVGESVMSRQALESNDSATISLNARRFLEAIRLTRSPAWLAGAGSGVI